MITTGKGIYRVSVVLEKIDPDTREILDSRKYRGVDISELSTAMKVLELSVKGRDRASVTRDTVKK